MTYVGAIHGLPGPVAIVEHSVTRDSWTDQGIDVQREEVVYRFDNGAVIRRSLEVEDFPTDLACGECWIDYEVLEHPSAQTIEPARKRFDNPCRETFWLQYHVV